MVSPADLTDMTPEELVARSRALGGEARDACLEALYRRFYPRVARWCLRVCGDRDRAEDVAQEVFLRVHTRLDSFRGRSSFSTWLYTVTRRVAINRMQAERLRRMPSIEREDGSIIERADPSPSPEDASEVREITGALRAAIRDDLEPLESQVLYLHFVDRISLPVITELLALTNKSGAKAYVVAGKRKLRRRFGRWLEAQGRGATP